MKKGDGAILETYDLLGIQVLANVHGVALGLLLPPNRLIAVNLTDENIGVLRQNLAIAEKFLKNSKQPPPN